MDYIEQPTMYLRRTNTLCKKGLLEASYILSCKAGKPRYIHTVTTKGFEYLKEVRDLLNEAIQYENKK